MIRTAAALVILSFSTVGAFPCQELQACQAVVPENATLAKTLFPSSPEFRSKAKIHLVRQGCLGACPQYSVTVYGNGKVVYEGREAVRVKGRAKVKLSDKAVDDLMLKINEMDFFGYQPRPGTSCVTDGPTASITVSEPSRQRTIEDECIEGREIEELETEIDKAVHLQRWVFIDAEELQSQIDRGWDIFMHGSEYARQAVEWDTPEVIRVLIRNGVSVEAVAYDGESLLQRAVTANRYASVKALLELGANPRALNSDGWGPAQNAGVGMAVRMRQQFQGSIDFTSNPNFSRFVGDPEIARASYLATQRQYEKVIEYLREHGGKE